MLVTLNLADLDVGVGPLQVGLSTPEKASQSHKTVGPTNSSAWSFRVFWRQLQQLIDNVAHST